MSPTANQFKCPACGNVSVFNWQQGMDRAVCSSCMRPVPIAKLKPVASEQERNQ